VNPSVVTFIQARMSSRRFPGKVLAPFRGRPVISHVVQAVTTALPSATAVVVTSHEASDDSLATYVASLGVPVFRGPLADVFQRFRDGLQVFPCEWLMRVSGDSPLLDPRILQAVVNRVSSPVPGIDLVTTIFPRSFPSGQNAELIRTDTLRSIDRDALTDHDREHVTPYFYRNPDRFGILNVSSGSPSLAATSLAVDSPEDLARLEALPDTEIQTLAAALHI
jgi:spore coat polysaccharide biosynthesis protein SpsF